MRPCFRRQRRWPGDHPLCADPASRRGAADGARGCRPPCEGCRAQGSRCVAACPTTAARAVATRSPTATTSSDHTAITAFTASSTKAVVERHKRASITATSATVGPVRQLVRFACRAVAEEVRLGDEGVRRVSAVPKVATIGATTAIPSASFVTTAVAASTSRGTLPNAIAAVIAAIAVATLAAGATSAHPQPVFQLVRASRRQLAGEVRLVEQHMLCVRLMPSASITAAAAATTLDAAPSHLATTVPTLTSVTAVGAIAAGHASVHCGLRYEAGLTMRRLVRGSCVPMECEMQLGVEPLLRMRRLPLALGRQLGGMHGVGR